MMIYGFVIIPAWADYWKGKKEKKKLWLKTRIWDLLRWDLQCDKGVVTWCGNLTSAPKLGREWTDFQKIQQYLYKTHLCRNCCLKFCFIVSSLSLHFWVKCQLLSGNLENVQFLMQPIHLSIALKTLGYVRLSLFDITFNVICFRTNLTLSVSTLMSQWKWFAFIFL